MSARVVLPLLLLAACENDWRTDMWYQPAVQPFEAPARPPPADSVPLGAPPVLADRDEAAGLRDPVPRASGSVANGAAIFGERCLCCHGPKGRGDGPVSKVFPQATDLTSSTVRARTDGYLFGTITFGGRAMPPYPEGLTREERWDVVNFVRTLQAGGAP